jgi:hypothetical protein
MKKIIFGAFAFAIMGCKHDDLKNEVEKWKIELQVNGEIGPSCTDKNGNITPESSSKWLYDNTHKGIGGGFGLGEIISLEHDFNSDKIIDGFYYFSPSNCSGGIGSSTHISDYGMLVYSHKGKLLTNKNITTIIEKNVTNKLCSIEKYHINISTIHIYYKEFNKNIEGTFEAYLDSDAGCCPSYNGSFKYNPIDFSIEISKTN